MALKQRKSNVAQPAPECPLTACMTLLGGAWTPNVIWYLSGGPRRFGELRRDIPRISAKVLAARLKILEEKGVVHREVLPTSPPSVEYRLTELGNDLLPVIDAIVKVGHRLRLDHGTEPVRRGMRKAA
jgi:DNA-binding HxlR family transcriptional regulator